MPTVYALDVRRKKRVRVDGVVHYAAHEGFEIAGETPKPWRTRCGAPCATVLNYVGDDEDLHVTCIACAALG